MSKIYATRDNVTGEPILVEVGSKGFWPTDEETYARLRYRQTDAQTEAALIGSMFGWNVPGASKALNS